jgi:DNA replication protein DnaC
VDFFNEIRATFDRETGICASDLIDAARQVDLLILDDIGTEKQESSWVNETMYAVLDHRLNQRKTTMFTSNCTIEELRHHDKIKSRIERMALPVWMPEEEIRADLARAENEELQKLLLGV